ncbi:MAG: hypothetical protein NC116_12265, partial [Clostridium sp.]|nr:hypothetical protein [Clostridium sp.]
LLNRDFDTFNLYNDSGVYLCCQSDDFEKYAKYLVKEVTIHYDDQSAYMWLKTPLSLGEFLHKKNGDKEVELNVGDETIFATVEGLRRLTPLNSIWVDECHKVGEIYVVKVRLR